MRWLPSLAWGDHAIYLAVDETEFDLLLDALAAERDRRLEVAVRLLVASPVLLLWTLASRKLRGGVPPLEVEDFSAAAAVFAPLDFFQDAPGERVAEPDSTNALICRMRTTDRQQYLRFLSELPAEPAGEQTAIAGRLLLSGLEFPGGEHAGPTRTFFQELVRPFQFRVTPQVGGKSTLANWLPERDWTETRGVALGAAGAVTRSDLRCAASRTERWMRLAQQARLRADDLQNEKLAALRQLAYGASHEINNPLANISSRAQLLLRGENDPQRRRHLASIHAQAMRAHEMICDMMLFAHPPAPRLQPVDLAGFVRQCVVELQARFADSGWEIEWVDDTACGELTVCLDHDLLSSLLAAIVQNATESQACGRVEIRARIESSRELSLAIQDNGPGVSPDLQRHMFDPFFSGREAGRGLGFGLSKAWVFAQLHGGALELAESHAQGTTLRLRLPYTRPAGSLAKSRMDSAFPKVPAPSNRN